MRLVRKDIKLTINEFIIENNSTIYYGLISPLNIRIGANSIIMGDIIARKNVVIDTGNTIHGDVLAKGDIIIRSNTKIFGNIASGGTIKLDNNILVSGKILADSDIIINTAKAESLECAGDITILGKIDAKSLNAGGRISFKRVV